MTLAIERTSTTWPSLRGMLLVRRCCRSSTDCAMTYTCRRLSVLSTMLPMAAARGSSRSEMMMTLTRCPISRISGVELILTWSSALAASALPRRLLSDLATSPEVWRSRTLISNSRATEAEAPARRAVAAMSSLSRLSSLTFAVPLPMPVTVKCTSSQLTLAGSDASRAT